MKALFKTIRIFAISCVWTVLYAGISVPVVYAIFSFNLLNLNQYIALWDAFVNYRWVIDSFARVLFVLVIISFIPLWFVGCIVAVKKWPWVHFNRRVTSGVSAKVLTMAKQERPKFTPQKMRLQTGGLLNIPLEEATQKQRQQMNQTFQEEDTSAGVMDLTETIQGILQLSKNYVSESFTNLLFGENRLPMAVSTDETAVLINFINYQNNTWSVDLSSGILDSAWFSEERQLEAPVKDFDKIVQILKESEPDCNIIPTFVIMTGTLLNAAETVRFYQENGYRIVSFNNDIDDVPTIKELFDEVFSLAQPEEQTEHRDETAGEAQEAIE